MSLESIRIQLLNQDTGEVEKEVDVKTSASAVTFEDGVNLETKMQGIDEEKGLSCIYDAVVRTQEEFETLINSPTWLDAKSICFIGDGGALKFIRSNGLGVKVPNTVMNIRGLNKATIEVTNFEYSSTNKGGLWYEDNNTDCNICEITVICSGLYDAITFAQCGNLTNCVSSSIADCDGSGNSAIATSYDHCRNLNNCTVISTSGNNGYAKGFSNCHNLSGCTGNITSNSNAIGFTLCNVLSNCLSNINTNANSTAFETCNNSINCIGTAKSTNDFSGRCYGFKSCTTLSNCIGTGISIGSIPSISEGYSFRDCSYMNNCRQGETASSSGFLGGTNTKVDTATVVAI